MTAALRHHLEQTRWASLTAAARIVEEAGDHPPVEVLAEAEVLLSDADRCGRLLAALTELET